MSPIRFVRAKPETKFIISQSHGGNCLKQGYDAYARTSRQSVTWRSCRRSKANGRDSPRSEQRIRSISRPPEVPGPGQNITLMPEPRVGGSATRAEPYVLERTWRASGSGCCGCPRRPTCGSPPGRCAAWRRWPPCCRTWLSGPPPSCCRRTPPRSSSCTRSSSASRSPRTVSRSARQRRRRHCPARKYDGGEFQTPASDRLDGSRLCYFACGEREGKMYGKARMAFQFFFRMLLSFLYVKVPFSTTEYFYPNGPYVFL